MKKTIIIIVSFVLVVAVVLLLTFSLFPKKYRADIEKYASLNNLPNSYVASVINMESGYDTNAISNAGAMGLMQLLPSTAFDCAERLKIEISEEQLLDKDTSLMLGCFYLRYLLDLFDGNWVNTLSAYNWGYGNVCNWIEMGNVDIGGTITNIPVKETREYIRKFEVCRYIYEKVYGYNKN